MVEGLESEGGGHMAIPIPMMRLIGHTLAIQNEWE